MILTRAHVLKQKRVAQDEYLLELECPEVAQLAKPGQFITLKLDRRDDPLLRRPFSIHYVDKEAGILFIYYQVLGKTTEEMSTLKEEESFSILGPLGKGFDYEVENSKILLIGGGLGQAPLAFLASELEKKGNNIRALVGAKTSLGLNNMECLGSSCEQTYLTTEDGSAGTCGRVTDCWDEAYYDFKPDRIYACGPTPMLKALKEKLQNENIFCEISLEEKMACGIGACLGCTCKKTEKDFFFHVCKDGPVFRLEEVDLG